MKQRIAAGLIVSACLAGAQFGVEASAAESKPWRVVSEQTVTGFAFPESVAYDPQAKVLYVSQFGGAKLGVEPLAKGFKGPADFAVIPGRNSMTVVVPDLVASELRIVRLGR